MKLSRIFVFILLVFCACAQAGPKNVMFFIGDGMGFEQVDATVCYLGQSLSFEGLPYTAECTTYSASSSVTILPGYGAAKATRLVADPEFVK